MVEPDSLANRELPYQCAAPIVVPSICCSRPVDSIKPKFAHPERDSQPWQAGRRPQKHPRGHFPKRPRKTTAMCANAGVTLLQTTKQWLAAAESGGLPSPDRLSAFLAVVISLTVRTRDDDVLRELQRIRTLLADLDRPEEHRFSQPSYPHHQPYQHPPGLQWQRPIPPWPIARVAISGLAGIRMARRREDQWDHSLEQPDRKQLSSCHTQSDSRISPNRHSHYLTRPCQPPAARCGGPSSPGQQVDLGDRCCRPVGRLIWQGPA